MHNIADYRTVPCLDNLLKLRILPQVIKVLDEHLNIQPTLFTALVVEHIPKAISGMHLFKRLDELLHMPLVNLHTG